MQDLYPKFQAAADEFIERSKQEDDVIGIILTGSFVHGSLAPNSDLDFYLILDEKCVYRERGNTWINGIEIEYFKNPPQQIRTYFKREQVSPHTAHMLAKGKLVFQKSPIVDMLIKEAQLEISKQVNPLNEFQLELWKYKFDDWFKDLEDTREIQNILAFQLIKNQIIDESINLFCAVHQIKRQKHKNLNIQLSAINKEFSTVLMNTFINNDLMQLRFQIEKLLKGWRSKEWKLSSGLDLD